MPRMPDFEADIARDWHAAGDTLRHLMHPHQRDPAAQPQPPATCGQCQDGVIPVSGCTCGDGLPPYGHEPGCGFEPCPNGCWDILHPPAPATQTPAAAPVNLAAAPAAAVPPGGTMSPASDVEQGYAAVKAELAKLESSLPTLVGQAKKMEGNPLAQLAITAGEHVISGVLPTEAIQVIADGGRSLLDGLLSLYSQPAQPAPAPAAPAPAQ